MPSASNTAFTSSSVARGQMAKDFSGSGAAEEVKAAFEAEGMTVKTCRGHRYVGGYVGSLAMISSTSSPSAPY